MGTSRFSTAGSPGLRPRAVTPEEAAAVIAAVEQFLRDTAPAFVQEPEPAPSPWKQEALLEGVSRWPEETASAS